METAHKITMAVEIEEYKNSYEEHTYLESISKWAEDNDCDIQDVAKNLPTALMEKLVKECHDAGLVTGASSSNATSLEMLM